MCGTMLTNALAFVDIELIRQLETLKLIWGIRTAFNGIWATDGGATRNHSDRSRRMTESREVRCAERRKCVVCSSCVRSRIFDILLVMPGFKRL